MIIITSNELTRTVGNISDNGSLNVYNYIIPIQVFISQVLLSTCCLAGQLLAGQLLAGQLLAV